MGGRDAGPKTSMMRDRDDEKHHGPPIDGTEEELEAAVEDTGEDEDLAEAKAIDLCDVPEDDYVQDDSPYRGVIDPNPCPPGTEREKRGKP